MLSERMRELKPYTPGEQPRDRSYVKLNTNENPYPPTPRIRDFLQTFDPETLRLYPDPESLDLKKAIAAAAGLQPDQVLAGNGSDEVLSFAYYAFFDGSRGPLLFPQFSYTFYPVYADFYGIPFERVAMKRDFSINLEEFLEKPICGAILPNPNAPTGMALSRKDLDAFIQRFPSDRVIIIDEAYVSFGGETVAPLIDKYPNLLVVRTLSKDFSLAGIRLGYALGQKPLIDAVAAVKNSFNSYPVDTLASNIALLALEDREYYAELSRKIQTTREVFTRTLDEMGWETLPSRANFVFTRKKGLPGEEVYRELRNRGFLVRYFKLPGIEEFVRITIGTDDQMTALSQAMGNLAVKKPQEPER